MAVCIMWKRGYVKCWDGMKKVPKMLTKYEDPKCVSVAVVKGKVGLDAGINTKDVEEQIPIAEIRTNVIYSADIERVMFKSQ